MCVCGGRGDWAAVFNNLDAAGLCKGEKITCKGDCFFQCHLSRLWHIPLFTGFLAIIRIFESTYL